MILILSYNVSSLLFAPDDVYIEKEIVFVLPPALV